MREVEKTGDRLVFAGVPGQKRWMIALVVVGVLLTAVVLAAGAHELRQGNIVNLFWIALGLLIAQGLLWTGAITLIFGRERLALDRTTGRGVYTVRSPIVEVGERPFEFDLSEVESVSIELALETIRGQTASGLRREGEAEVYRARLLVRKPRRAVTLIETGESRLKELTRAADAVASFLGVEVEDRRETDRSERASAETRKTPLAARGGAASLDLPPQPEPAEWAIDIDPEGARVTLRRMKRGGPLIVGCLMLIGTFIGVIAVAISVAAWLPNQTFNGEPIPAGVRWALTAPGVLAVVAVPWAWLALVRGYRLVTIDTSEVRAQWIYPGRALLAGIPGLRRVIARGERVPTSEVDGVRVIKTPSGRVVEVRADQHRVRFGSDAEDEDAQKASLTWAGDAVRSCVRMLGAE